MKPIGTQDVASLRARVNELESEKGAPKDEIVPPDPRLTADEAESERLS